MMATSKIDSCLESITAPSVSDFACADYTDVNKSYFEQEHAEMESTMSTPSNQKESVSRTKRRESLAMSTRRAKVSAEYRLRSKLASSLPDVSSPAAKRTRCLDDVTNVDSYPAKTPNVMRRGLAQREKAKSKIKTTEALEEERIAQEKERVKLLQKQTKEMYAKSKKGPQKALERKVLESTKVKEFHFATDSRVKPANKEDDDVKNFVETLRTSVKEDFKIPKSGRTEVKPFNLTEGKKRSHGDAFKSLAEGVLAFSKPSLRSREKESSDNQEGYHFRPSTIAKTPNFSKRVRRPQKIETSKDVEQRELEECRKQFKAHPLKESVLKRKAPLKEVEKRPTTKIEPFKITDESNKKEKIVPKKEEPVELEARKGSTSVVPFSFDERDKRRYQNKAQKIKEELERERKLHEFQAHPMPIYDEPHGIPEAKPLKPTKVEPFKLREPTKTHTPVKEEKRNFRARPAKVLQTAPFFPKTGEIPPVLPDKAFALHTDQRSEDRERFLLEKKEREAEIMAVTKQREEEQEKKEEERVRQQRADAVHKAQPVHHYKSIEVKHGLIPVTKPVSPKFSDRFKK